MCVYVWTVYLLLCVSSLFLLLDSRKTFLKVLVGVKHLDENQPILKKTSWIRSLSTLRPVTRLKDLFINKKLVF